MWLILAITTGIFFSAQGLLTRRFLKENDDAWAYSLIFSIVGTVLTLPFAIYDWRVEADARAWIIIGITTAIIVVHNLLLFESAKHLEASLSGVINKTRIIWVFILSYVFLDQAAEFSTFFAIILSILATALVSHTFRRPSTSRGIVMVLIASLLNAILLVSFKDVLDQFSVFSFTFVASFALPAILNAVLIPRPIPRIKAVLAKDARLILAACTLGGTANIFLILGLDLATNTSALLVVTEASLILTLVGEHLILKETSYLHTKILAVALAVISSLLLI